MKIKVILVTQDKDYLDKLRQRLNSRYEGRVQFMGCADLTDAVERAKLFRPDVFITGEEIELKGAALPKRCAHAVLIEKKGIQSIADTPAIYKYQSTADWLSNCLEIYANRADSEKIRFNQTLEQKKVVTFFPGAGGVGSSTMAASYALYLANRGEKVLYLNLEPLGTADTYFTGNPANNLSRVLYALQIDSPSTVIKLENALNQDQSGVWFYSGLASALDFEDIDPGTMELLFERLSGISSFDWIVVDMAFSVNELAFAQIRRSAATVFVSDGTPSANAKLKRISDALELRGGKETDGKLFVMYNRYSSQGASRAKDTIFAEAGGVGRIENADTADLLKLISQSSAFDGLI